jgi:hypothetical protein
MQPLGVNLWNLSQITASSLDNFSKQNKMRLQAIQYRRRMDGNYLSWFHLQKKLQEKHSYKNINQFCFKV